MAGLYLLGEGETETTFAAEVLKPHLEKLGVFLYRAMGIAHAEKHRIVHRGGGRRYQPMRKDIHRQLTQEKAKDLFVTTMIDLYGIHPEFPNLAEAEKHRRSPQKRVEFLERAFAEDIDSPRFIPCTQLHEYEAYLFSDPTHFRYVFGGRAREVTELCEIAGSRSPELIDDGPKTAPSKRILALFPDYRKVVDGVKIAELIGLNTIRARCPHFDSWLTRLEKLAN